MMVIPGQDTSKQEMGVLERVMKFKSGDESGDKCNYNAV